MSKGSRIFLTKTRHFWHLFKISVKRVANFKKMTKTRPFWHFFKRSVKSVTKLNFRNFKKKCENERNKCLKCHKSVKSVKRFQNKMTKTGHFWHLLKIKGRDFWTKTGNFSYKMIIFLNKCRKCLKFVKNFDKNATLLTLNLKFWTLLDLSTLYFWLFPI